ncbi:MAG: carboxypeptidase-like regulatory domain-containing protein, partial [Saprospiraceae bacterium]|nr:carboxypeptidase-like regulatory domain-containing protein [Saprospiraceae bacterium]
MNNRQLLLLLVALLPFFAAAQTQTLRGTVYDQQAETPLIGATVQLITEGQPIGATTDVNGTFALKNVPVGRQALRVTYLGYEPQ